jgi:exonuclease III
MNTFVLLTALVCAHTVFSTQHPMPASAWSALAQGERLRRDDLVSYFVKDCRRDAPHNATIPHVNKHIMRVATYNIHHWRPPHHAFNTPFDYACNDHFNQIISTIKKVNADILIVQEMLIFDWDVIKKAFEAMGYYCSLNAFFQSATYHNCPFGTMIFSKIKTTKPYLKKTYETQIPLAQELHGFIKMMVELPNNQELIVYGTHLDVQDNTEHIRYGQVQELIRYANKETVPCIVAADFNAIRAQDYAYLVNNIPVWHLLNDDHKKRAGFDVPTSALNLFKENKFFDCFTQAALKNPYYSVWNGTVVDFLWLNNQWNLPISGCYVYYSSASDHLPIIMDITV